MEELTATTRFAGEDHVHVTDYWLMILEISTIIGDISFHCLRPNKHNGGVVLICHEHLFSTQLEMHYLSRCLPLTLFHLRQQPSLIGSLVSSLTSYICQLTTIDQDLQTSDKLSWYGVWDMYQSSTPILRWTTPSLWLWTRNESSQH